MNDPVRVRTGVAIRPLRLEDAESIVALYRACRAVETDLPCPTVASWQRDMGRSQFGYGRDVLVACEGEVLIGLAESVLRDQGARRYRHLRIVVDPRRRRRGLGRHLLRAVLAQGPMEDDLSIGGFIGPDWTAGVAFAHRFGFAETERAATLRCAALREAPTPDGVVIGPAGASDTDVARLAAIQNEAFADDTGFEPVDARAMSEHLTGLNLWTARIGDQVVGYALIEPDAQGGLLDRLAVASAWRGRGIGAALAFRALEDLRIGDGRTADVDVLARNGAASRLYARLGFVLVREEARYVATRAILGPHVAGD